MSEFSSALAVSASALRAQAARLRHVSENISNAGTPGYRRKTVSFELAATGAEGPDLVRVGRVRLDETEPERVFDPSHPLADEDGYFQGSNVDLMIEVADAREAQRSYEANLNVVSSTRRMLMRTLDILKG